MRLLVEVYTYLSLLALVVVAHPTTNFNDNHDIETEVSEPRAEASLFGLKFGSKLAFKPTSKPQSPPSSFFGSRGSGSKPVSSPSRSPPAPTIKKIIPSPSPSPSPSKVKKIDKKNEGKPSPSPSTVKEKKKKKYTRETGPSPLPSSKDKDGNKSKTPKEKYEKGNSTKKDKKLTTKKKGQETPVQSKPIDQDDDKAPEKEANELNSRNKKSTKAADPKKKENDKKRKRKDRSAKNVDGKNPSSKGGEDFGDQNPTKDGAKDKNDLERIDVRNKKLGTKAPSNNGDLNDQDQMNNRNRNINDQDQFNNRNGDFNDQSRFGGRNMDFNNQDSFKNGMMGDFNDQDRFGSGNFQNSPNRFGNQNRHSLFASPGPIFNTPGDLLQFVPNPNTLGQLFSSPNNPPPVDNNLSFSSPLNSFQPPPPSDSGFNGPLPSSSNPVDPNLDNSKSFDSHLDRTVDLPSERSRSFNSHLDKSTDSHSNDNSNENEPDSPQDDSNAAASSPRNSRSFGLPSDKKKSANSPLKNSGSSGSALDEGEDNDAAKCLDAEVFVHLVDYCPNIRSMNLFGVINLDADGLFTHFVRSTRMVQLNLSYTTCFLQEAVSDYICCLPLSLVDLCLSGTQVYNTSILVRALTRLARLEHLRLNGLATISDDALEKILCVIGRRLKTLEMNGYITVGSLTDRSVEHIVRYCPSLEHLSLNLLSFTSTLDSLDTLFSAPARALQLHTVSLSSFRNINPQVLWSLVENCSNIKLLELSGIPCVNDALISALRHCHKLSHLNIKGCKQVTDASICDLLGTCRFVSLVLSGCYQLTDQSILAMAHTQPFLEEIYISGCVRISPAAVRYLQDSTIRRLYIDHKIPNALPDALMARNLDTGLFEQVK